jgi:Predicted metal-dependent protease of the PAD1/JAB1 superfamily
VLRLTEEHRRELEAHGERGYPEEICGFLIGTAAGGEKRVTRLIAIENTWDDAGEAEFAATGPQDFATVGRRRRFKIPPEEYYREDKAARERGESILGFYHTHPDHPARPSPYDLALAQEIFPGYSYIILSVRAGRADEMTSWVLRDDYTGFDAEPIAPVESAGGVPDGET